MLLVGPDCDLVRRDGCLVWQQPAAHVARAGAVRAIGDRGSRFSPLLSLPLTRSPVLRCLPLTGRI